MQKLRIVTESGEIVDLDLFVNVGEKLVNINDAQNALKIEGHGNCCIEVVEVE